MSHEDSGWRPTASGMEAYDGHEVWCYAVGPHEINEGEVDGDIEFDLEDPTDEALENVE